MFGFYDNPPDPWRERLRQRFVRSDPYARRLNGPRLRPRRGKPENGCVRIPVRAEHTDSQERVAHPVATKTTADSEHKAPVVEPDHELMTPASSPGSEGPSKRPTSKATEPAPEPTVAADGSEVDEPPAENTVTSRARQWQQALAELEAAKQRAERETERLAHETRGKLIGQLLPVLDNLDRAISATDDGPSNPLLDGVTLVREQLEQVLLSYGAERISAVGERFDPAVHEAVAVTKVDDLDQAGVVLEQWEAGYQLDGKVLRAAKVRVAKAA